MDVALVNLIVGLIFLSIGAVMLAFKKDGVTALVICVTGLLFLSLFVDERVQQKVQHLIPVSISETLTDKGVSGER